MAGYDGDGGLVKQFPYSTGASEDVNVTVLSNCGGGMVTSTCPFTDTDLDRAYIHSSIVSITNKANKMTYNGDWVNQNIKETSDGGTGQVWVQAGDLGGGVNHEAGLINVYASDKQGDAEYACTSGASGGDLALEASQSGLDPNQCTWQEYPGGN